MERFSSVRIITEVLKIIVMCRAGTFHIEERRGGGGCHGDLFKQDSMKKKKKKSSRLREAERGGPTVRLYDGVKRSFRYAKADRGLEVR